MTTIESVIVTAADYNGIDFDGCPFSALPDWLLDAARSGAIAIKPDDRDYAMWRVGNAIAEPGDSIVRLGDGTLAVEKQAVA